MNNSCDITALDYTPNGGGWPANTTWHTGDWTGGNGTNQAGNGQCALFDPRGGGMQFKPLPGAALTSPRLGRGHILLMILQETWMHLLDTHFLWEDIVLQASACAHSLAHMSTTAHWH